MAAPNPVTVAVRIRPLNDKEKRVPDQEISLDFGEQHVTLPKHDATFCFDAVLGPEHTNEALYDSIASPIVDSALQGINGTIFAYGQTASGKTFSMQGDAKCPGILRLAAAHIFDPAKHQSTPPGAKFSFVASYIEIYNERVKDLLSTSAKIGGAADDLKIREDKVMGFYADGATERAVTCAKDVIHLFQEGEKRRHVAGTDMNLKSSRSHTIFMINMTTTQFNATTKSRLSLVDLAGSESVRQTNAEGDRLKEGAQINKSLLALSMVISSLSSGKKDIGHVGYRDSKLTQILRPSLSGNCKTAVLVCVSPAMSFAFETLSSLKFASSAKQIKTSYVVNRTTTAATAMHSANMRSYQDQIDFLTRSLQEERVSALEQQQDQKAMAQLEDALRQKENEWEELLQHTNGEVDEARAQNAALQDELVVVERERSAQEDEIAALKKIIVDWDAAYAEQTKTLEASERAWAQSKAECDALRQQAEQEKLAAAALQNEIDTQRFVVQSQTDTMLDYKQELQRLVDELAKSRAEADGAAAALDQVRQQLANLRVDHDAALACQHAESTQQVVAREQQLRDAFRNERAALATELENKYMDAMQDLERAGMDREQVMQTEFDQRAEQDKAALEEHAQQQQAQATAAHELALAALHQQLAELQQAGTNNAELEQQLSSAEEENGRLRAKLVVLEQDLDQARQGEHLIAGVESERQALLEFRVESEHIQQDLRSRLQAERGEVKTLRSQLGLLEAEMNKLKLERDRQRKTHEQAMEALENQLHDDENLELNRTQKENARLKQVQARLDSLLQEQEEKLDQMARRETELLERNAKLDKCKFTAEHKRKFETLNEEKRALQDEVTRLKMSMEQFGSSSSSSSAVVATPSAPSLPNYTNIPASATAASGKRRVPLSPL